MGLLGPTLMSGFCDQHGSPIAVRGVAADRGWDVEMDGALVNPTSTSSLRSRAKDRERPWGRRIELLSVSY